MQLIRLSAGNERLITCNRGSSLAQQNRAGLLPNYAVSTYLLYLHTSRCGDDTLYPLSLVMKHHSHSFLGWYTIPTLSCAGRLFPLSCDDSLFPLSFDDTLFPLFCGKTLFPLTCGDTLFPLSVVMIHYSHSLQWWYTIATASSDDTLLPLSLVMNHYSHSRWWWFTNAPGHKV